MRSLLSVPSSQQRTPTDADVLFTQPLIALLSPSLHSDRRILSATHARGMPEHWEEELTKRNVACHSCRTIADRRVQALNTKPPKACNYKTCVQNLQPGFPRNGPAAKPRRAQCTVHSERSWTRFVLYTFRPDHDAGRTWRKRSPSRVRRFFKNRLTFASNGLTGASSRPSKGSSSVNAESSSPSCEDKYDRTWASGFKGSGFRAFLGLGFRAWGLGFMV